MAITANTYKQMIRSAYEGEINFVVGTVMCSLHTGVYIPDVENHRYYSQLVGEVEGQGYTAGGLEVTNSSLALQDGKWIFDGDNPRWEDVTLSDVRYIVFYMNEVDKPLLGYADLVEPRSVENGVFMPILSEEGLMTIEVIA